jgi:hypothetical protein
MPVKSAGTGARCYRARVAFGGLAGATFFPARVTAYFTRYFD